MIRPLLENRSCVATNYHPAISPDGARIAFVSDRAGPNNLWIMDASTTFRVFEPVWTPDGDYSHEAGNPSSW